MAANFTGSGRAPGELVRNVKDLTDGDAVRVG